MIHIFIGTKAQYVKTAPVLKELDKLGIPYNLIDSGQHSALSKNYREYFSIKSPDRLLRDTGKDITTVKEMISWFFKFLFQILISPQSIARDIFDSKKGICLIHGDTPTTLLSAIAAKRVGIKVAHLESGLRSNNIFHPFPEEIIRIMTMHLSDYLFAPSPWAYNNLRGMRLKGKSYLIGGNTNIDVLRYAQSHNFPNRDIIKLEKPYVVFSIHRVETILSRKRLTKIIDLAKKISEKFLVLFCIHPPTKRQLKKFNLEATLRNMPNVHTRELLPYPEFIMAIKQAHFIVTDGGSVQEESYFLKIPCLLMRNRTERMEGIQQNVFISEFKDDKIQYFLEHIETFRKSDYSDKGESPSKEIVGILLNEIKEV